MENIVMTLALTILTATFLIANIWMIAGIFRDLSTVAVGGDAAFRFGKVRKLS